VTLQLFDAEQLRAQQFSIPVVTQRIPRARQKGKIFNEYGNLLVRTRVVRAEPDSSPIFVKHAQPVLSDPQQDIATAKQKANRQSHRLAWFYGVVFL
jgi:hypothetical protein